MKERREGSEGEGEGEGEVEGEREKESQLKSLLARGVWKMPSPAAGHTPSLGTRRENRGVDEGKKNDKEKSSVMLTRERNIVVLTAWAALGDRPTTDSSLIYNFKQTNRLQAIL